MIAHFMSSDVGRQLELKSEFEWAELIGRYCPIAPSDSIWRLNRNAYPDEPEQGWKLHISATVLEACRVFRSVVDFLVKRDLQFKVPKSLKELSLINAGLGVGYTQVGKFLTVYPRSGHESVELAKRLDELTCEFTAVSIPFDRSYGNESNVHSRFGAFSFLEIESSNGRKIPAIRDLNGELVADDRRQPAPPWIEDPFPDAENDRRTFANTPLGEKYRVFSAISQRGKGGVYLAANLTGNEPDTCVVKEGRRNGEIGWDLQDGYFRVKTELTVLTELAGKVDGVPAVIDSFEVHGNYYLVLEHVHGTSIESALLRRRRRLSIREIISLTREICGVLHSLHSAGWIWGDCKPANLIRSSNGKLRPIDFEGAYRVGEPDPYRWRTKGFSDAPRPSGGVANDLFSLGASLYFFIAGRVYDAQAPIEIAKLRKGVPIALIDFTFDLLESRCVTAGEASRRLASL